MLLCFTAPPNTPSRVIVRALYDYEPRQADDLGFMKGDRMEVIKSTGYISVDILNNFELFEVGDVLFLL